MINNLALITGASSGIGLEFAHIHANKGGNLLLVARRRDRLEALAAELESKHKAQVHILPVDLAKEGAIQELTEFIDENQLQVEVLINNAAFGGHGDFLDRELHQDLNMIQLNISALVELCHIFGNRMRAAGGGKILNVASTAAFLPGPLQATYYATKAFVLSFSEALAEELSGTGVSITTLCPGPTDSEFVQAADLDGVAGFKFMRVASSKEVAEYGYRALQRGQVVAIEGWLNWVGAQSSRLTPRSILRKVSKQIMTKH